MRKIQISKPQFKNLAHESSKCREVANALQHVDNIAFASTLPRMTTPQVLDIGCGTAKTPGALGIDILAAPGVDIVQDLNVVPWPLEADRFDLVIASHVLEHLTQLVPVMEEIHRVSKNGARVKIITPHFSSLNSWEDPTHTRHFALRSFSFFDTGSRHHYTSKCLKTVSAKISFGGGLWDLCGKLHYKLWPTLWEKHFAFIWRARNLIVELEVVK